VPEDSTPMNGTRLVPEEKASSAGPAPQRADAADLADCARTATEILTDGSLSRIRLSYRGVELELERPAGGAVPGVPPAGPAPAAVPATSPASRPAPTADSPAPAAPDAIVVTAPLVGVFYCSPGPGKPPFVEVGSKVEAGQQVAIVEAMKTMNPVLAEQAGTVAEVLATDGDVVEFEQPLIALSR
jgi:acetyl-CoA carboxylase biotin carboxyl carrier protein